jgi:hypothetical protein
MSEGSHIDAGQPPTEKKIHLFMDGAPQQCNMSEVHFGTPSPFLLIFVISVPKPSNDARRTDANMTEQFTRDMAQFTVNSTPLFPTLQITGIL